MARPSKKTPEQKLHVVMPVLRGEASAAEAGRTRASRVEDGEGLGGVSLC